tara:strand:- start:601 stop:810 length:210 start_codon:yes stop_codon:yes gene_type:complete
VLINVVCWHLAFHLKVSQILYEQIDSLFFKEFTNHRLLFISKDDFEQKPLQKASQGVWTTLQQELKVIR